MLSFAWLWKSSVWLAGTGRQGLLFTTKEEQRGPPHHSLIILVYKSLSSIFRTKQQTGLLNKSNSEQAGYRQQHVLQLQWALQKPSQSGPLLRSHHAPHHISNPRQNSHISPRSFTSKHTISDLDLSLPLIPSWGPFWPQTFPLHSLIFWNQWLPLSVFPLHFNKKKIKNLKKNLAERSSFQLLLHQSQGFQYQIPQQVHLEPGPRWPSIFRDSSVKQGLQTAMNLQSQGASQSFMIWSRKFCGTPRLETLQLKMELKIPIFNQLYLKGLYSR